MNILVCFKIVPDWERVLERDWENFTPGSDIAYAGLALNCFDETALELGLRLKEEAIAQGRACRCVAVTAGVLPPEGIVQTLYAAGYDEVAVLAGQGPEFCPEETAKQLAAWATPQNFDVVLAGSAAGMADTGTLPFYLAGALNIPVLAEASDVALCDDGIAAHCQNAGGLWRWVAATPLLVTAGNSTAVLRAVTLKARLGAKGRHAVQVAAPPQNSACAPPKLSRPKRARHCRMLPEAGADALAAALLEELAQAGTGGHNPPVAQGFVLPKNIKAVTYRLERPHTPATEFELNWLLQDWQNRKPGIAFLPGTPKGRQLAAQLATKAGAACAVGVCRLKADEHFVTVWAKACSSNLEWERQLELPVILTLAQGAPKGVLEVTLPPEGITRPGWLAAEQLVEVPAGASLQNQKLIVACGAGMGSRKACDEARQLANLLGAGFGLTRAALLSGWGRAEELIGQSGVLTAPESCLVLGAAGAGAFMVGIENATQVIAVNRDSGALIFNGADIGLHTDAPALVEALIKLLTNRGRPA